MGIIAFPVFLFLIFRFEDGIARHFIEALFNQVNMWSWVLALFGLSSVFLNRKSQIIIYCNRAVYPFYILHQTVIVVLAYWLMNLNWGLLAKFSTLVIGTFLICWILYEFLIRKSFLLNILMGVKHEKRKKVGAFNYPASLQISYFPEAYALNDILNIGIIS